MVTCLSFSPLANLLVSGHHDKTLRVWDPRKKGPEAIKFRLLSHQQWVADVAWARHDDGARHFISGSHDHTVPTDSYIIFSDVHNPNNLICW